MVLGGQIGPMKVTYSKYAQHPDHKRKDGGREGGGGGGTPLLPIPEPKRPEIHVPDVSSHVPVNPVREKSNNDVIGTVTHGIPNHVPVRPPIDDKYLVIVILCAAFYLYTTHAPEKFRFIRT